MADMYRVRGMHSEAADWYSKAVTLEGAGPLQTYYYAQSLRNIGNYEEALKQYRKFAEQSPNDPRGAEIASGLADLDRFYKDSSRYFIRNVEELNTDKADFSPAWYKNKALAFVSAGQKGKIDNRWSGQIFFDIYYADYDTINKKFSQPKIFSPRIQTDYHEGPVTFDSTFNRMIFTRNNVIKKTKKSQEGIVKLNLFESTQTDGNWNKAARLPFNSTEYSCGHPTITKDGRLMIFASDMPGGLGGQDLYYVEYKAEKWGEPVNLGPDINTPGDEVFPFLHEDGTLIFASDARPGLGGLDIYSAEKTGERKWGNVQHLGAPINTRFDDFGLIYNKQKTQGYFSSNREGGKGDDDIYYFDNTRFRLKVFVYDKATGIGIEKALVRVSEKTDTIRRVETDKEGRVTVMKLEFGKTFTFKASKEGYRSNYVTINTREFNANEEIRIPLNQGFVLEALVVDKVTQNPIDAATVQIQSEKYGVESAVTSAKGLAYFVAKAGQTYKAIADKFGYFLVSPQTVSTLGIPDNQDTIRVKLELNYLAAGAIVKLENIYYDFDKYNIRRDAAEELDRLVEIMNKYPKMKIEMRSHTDSRGSDAYNMTLSNNRAKSAAKYLISKGIDKSRIVYKGYGETVPVNKCTNNVPCSEEEHQMNRRTEFKVLVQPDGMEIKGTVQ
jgi:outer membrane protein OmpA-like peptidoglycan-associated protein